MKDYAKAFYKSKAWQDCRAAYAKSKGGLCEICLAKGIYRAGEIVHHKKHIDMRTITDPMILLSFGNLQLVCRFCHADLHRGYERRYIIDEGGHVVAR